MDPQAAYQTVTEVAATIASSTVLEDVLRTITRKVGEAMDVTACDIHDYSAETGLLTFVANWELEPESEDVLAYYGATFPPSEWPSLVTVIEQKSTVEVHIDDRGLPDVERKQMERWGQKATLDAPLVFGDEVIGVLGLVEWRTPRRFTEQERDLFSRLADLAAIAIHNARMFRRLEEQNRHLSSLLDASRALASEVELTRVLGAMAAQTAHALSSSRCVVCEYDVNEDALVRRAVFDLKPVSEYDDTDTSFPLDERPTDRAILAGGEIVVEQASDGSLEPGTRRLLEALGEKTCLNIPLVFQGEPLGMMRVIETSCERHYTVSEIELAQGLGEQAATAFQNGRLFQRLEDQAIKDGLTGLYNHRFFYERLGEEVARSTRYGSPVSLLMLDIDDFKRFNDAHGHQAGDAALREVSSVLQTRLRRSVDIPARYGGEEFAVILPNTPLDGAQAAGVRLAKEVRAGVGSWPFADKACAQPNAADDEEQQGALSVGERIRRDIESRTVVHEGEPLPDSITVSVGVASCPEHAAEPDTFVAAADAALYLAKAQGKNRVCVADDALP